jgi:hypothetical protein
MPSQLFETIRNRAATRSEARFELLAAPCFRLPRVGGSVLALCLCTAGCQPLVDADVTESEATESTAEREADPGAEGEGFLEPSASERSSRANAEVSVTPVVAPAVCTTDEVTAICEGTWRYQQWASCGVSDTGSVTPATCSSTPACATFNTCEDFSFGAGAPSTRSETFQHQVTTCRDRGCFDACDEEAANIQAAQDALRAEVPPEFQDQVTIIEQVEALVNSRRYSPGFLEDDKFDETRACTVLFEYPIPASGEGVICGCAAFECRSPGCGVDPNPVTSPPGLTLEALRAQDPNVSDTSPPSCSRCVTPDPL